MARARKAPQLRRRRMVIWTLHYVPFVMGGSVWQPMKTAVAAEGPCDLGPGAPRGWLVRAPDGTTHVAEGRTGALVGPSLEAVRADVAGGDPAVLARQLRDAAVSRRNAEEVTPEEFWRRIGRWPARREKKQEAAR